MKIFEMFNSFWADCRDRGAMLQLGEKPTDWTDFFWNNTILFLSISAAIIGNFTKIIESVGLTSPVLKVVIILITLLITSVICIRIITTKQQVGNKSKIYYFYKQNQRAIAKLLLVIAVILTIPTTVKFYLTTVRVPAAREYVWGYIKSEKGEAPLAGVMVKVYDSYGKLLGTNETDSNGKYIINFNIRAVPHIIKCNDLEITKFEITDVPENRRNFVQDIFILNPN
jgi:hypothetical protein